MKKLEQIKIKIDCIYVLNKQEKRKLFEMIKGFNDFQLLQVDKKLSIILEKLGDVTLKLAKKENKDIKSLINKYL